MLKNPEKATKIVKVDKNIQTRLKKRLSDVKKLKERDLKLVLNKHHLAREGVKIQIRISNDTEETQSLRKLLLDQDKETKDSEIKSRNIVSLLQAILGNLRREEQNTEREIDFCFTEPTETNIKEVFQCVRDTVEDLKEKEKKRVGKKLNLQLQKIQKADNDLLKNETGKTSQKLQKKLHSNRERIRNENRSLSYEDKKWWSKIHELNCDLKEMEKCQLLKLSILQAIEELDRCFLNIF